MTILNEELLYQIYSLVEEIPEGNVATYKQIAILIGLSRNARLVGKAMSMASMFGEFPCHRVVNSNGRLTPGWKEQESLLLQEGVKIKANGCVDLKKYQWDLK